MTITGMTITTMITTTITTTTTTIAAMDRTTERPDEQFLLMSWFSPSFPVGAFSYSHGIEMAVERGLVTDQASARDWIAAILSQGAGRIDAAFFLEAQRATRQGDRPRLAAAAELAGALKGSAEMALESRSQGEAFFKAVSQGWPELDGRAWDGVLGPRPAQAIVAGWAAGRAGIGEGRGLGAYLHAFAANLVWAAVRLVPLGQTDGVRAMRALAGALPELVGRAIRRPYGAIGGAALSVDWTSMLHETQYARLFRS